ncbi:uncharacterized protein MELLADRAFT_92090 [Melampsora larici-populina 98AG31]|uniref:Uncharacterized protein n=1 Tax=Melampsora larici-populina (strain 98AG31 / pathotype 3-4-7) TaxID=747676 RepID=F4SEM4_MELLP|nr:uncharacterized protein MELLADRAFT_92090 [Melampsora larici-populina 98AG31]EGF96902.1 hypothetical protein MELLADRAFT_92090 [Melampsora larici-populina 98AG31]
MEWGIAQAEQYLASLKLPKNNRPSGTGLYEAQSLQSTYELDKTMLCIVLKVSRRVIDKALLEGPLAREPNMYTNYQTYSNVATSTPMSPKGVSEGFRERNSIVGSTWSTYIDEEQEIFMPRLFERLCVATSEAYAMTQTPLGIPSSNAVQETAGPSKNGLEPLTQDKITKYVPVFERLVNLQKVSQDLHQGRLWRHSGKSNNRSSEQLMKQEIGKVVRQGTEKKSPSGAFHLQIHKGAAASPFEASRIQGSIGICRLTGGKAIRTSTKPQQFDRSSHFQLAPYLRGGYLSKGDAHPKCPELREAFAKKTFRGDVALTSHQTPESRVTDIMLSKGPGCLTNDEVDAWLDDINTNNYTIISVKKTKKHEKGAEEECNSSSSKCDSSFESVDAQILEALTGVH